MKNSILAWVLAALLTTSIAGLVLSNDPVAAGPDDEGKTSGTGEVQTSGE
ncbi:hypothetical protein [Hyphomicrobium sp.]